MNPGAPPFPRRDRSRIRPKAAAFVAGAGVERDEARIVRVAPIPPGEALVDEGVVERGTARKESPGGAAAVAIAVANEKDDLLLIDEVGGAAVGGLPEELVPLGGANGSAWEVTSG